MKNAVSWNMIPCDSLRTDVSEERITSIIRVKRISKLGTRLAASMLIIANIPSSLILFTLMMEAIHASETFFLQEPHGVISKKTAFFYL
jgi:hypothetical protein